MLGLGWLMPLECEAKPFLGRSAPFRTIQSDVQYPDTFGCVVLMGGEHGTLAHKYRWQLKVQDAQGSGWGVHGGAGS